MRTQYSSLRFDQFQVDAFVAPMCQDEMEEVFELSLYQKNFIVEGYFMPY